MKKYINKRLKINRQGVPHSENLICRESIVSPRELWLQFNDKHSKLMSTASITAHLASYKTYFKEEALLRELNCRRNIMDHVLELKDKYVQGPVFYITTPYTDVESPEFEVAVKIFSLAGYEVVDITESCVMTFRAYTIFESSLTKCAPRLLIFKRTSAQIKALMQEEGQTK